MDILSAEFSAFSPQKMKDEGGFVTGHGRASFWYYHISVTFLIVFILRERSDESLKGSEKVHKLFKQMKLKREVKLGGAASPESVPLNNIMIFQWRFVPFVRFL